jgi:hypothetical protein
MVRLLSVLALTTTFGHHNNNLYGVGVVSASNPTTSLVSAIKSIDYRYFVAGGTCAAFSHGITTPIDVVKTKIQANPNVRSMILCVLYLSASCLPSFVVVLIFDSHQDLSLLIPNHKITAIQ